MLTKIISARFTIGHLSDSDARTAMDCDAQLLIHRCHLGQVDKSEKWIVWQMMRVFYRQNRLRDSETYLSNYRQGLYTPFGQPVADAPKRLHDLLGAFRLLKTQVAELPSSLVWFEQRLQAVSSAAPEKKSGMDNVQHAPVRTQRYRMSMIMEEKLSKETRVSDSGTRAEIFKRLETAYSSQDIAMAYKLVQGYLDGIQFPSEALDAGKAAKRARKLKEIVAAFRALIEERSETTVKVWEAGRPRSVSMQRPEAEKISDRVLSKAEWILQVILKFPAATS